MKSFRYYIFKLIDVLKGGQLADNLKDIARCHSDLIYQQEKQKERLSLLLTYATLHCSRYKSYRDRSLADFPVVKKRDIMDSHEDFFSEEYLATKQKLHIMATSGSTGTPFRSYQDSKKVLRNKADLLYYYRIGGYYPGDRLYYFRIWNKRNKKSRLQCFIQNLVMFDSSVLGNNGLQALQEIMQKDRRRKVILSYASTLIGLLKESNTFINASNWRVKSIFSGAEELPIPVKHRLQSMFCCPVISRYSNQENGILAQQPATGEDYFVLNEASYVFEFLKLESDMPAEPGEDARIVITDLYNYACPMIRYDTGDIGVYSIKDGRRILDRISGRVVDLLVSEDGELISAHTITNMMWLFEGIKEFQFTQLKKDHCIMTLSLQEEKDFSREEKLSLTKNIQDVIGSGVSVDINIVKDIPLEPSGKRKYIKSLVLVKQPRI